MIFPGFLITSLQGCKAARLQGRFLKSIHFSLYSLIFSLCSVPVTALAIEMTDPVQGEMVHVVRGSINAPTVQWMDNPEVYSDSPTDKVLGTLTITANSVVFSYYIGPDCSFSSKNFLFEHAIFVDGEKMNIPAVAEVKDAAYEIGDEHGIYFIVKGDGTAIAEGTSVSMDMKSQIKDKIVAGPYTATYCIQGMAN